MKVCPQCRTRYDEDTKFCSDCGTTLIDLLEEELPEEPAEPLTAAQPAEEDELAAPPQEPVEEPAPPAPGKKELRRQKKEEKQRRKEERLAQKNAPIGAGRRLLAALLCVLLLAVLLSAGVIAMIRAATTEKGLTAALADVDLGQVRVDPYFDDVDEELTLGRLMAEDLEGLGVTLDEKDVNKFLRRSTLKSFFSGELAALLDDVYAGKSRYEYDRRMLADELMNSRNTELLEREGVKLERETAGQIAAMIDGYGFGDLMDREELRDEYPALYTALHYGMSYVTLALLLLIALLLVVLIFRANRGRIGVSLGDVGGVLTAVGALLSLATVFAQALPSLWRSVTGGDELIALLSGAVLRSQIRGSLAVLAVGVVLILLGRLLRPRRKREPAPEAAA